MQETTHAQEPIDHALPCASVSKRVFLQNLSYENEFDLNENEQVGGTQLRTRLVLTQRQHSE